MWRMEGLGHGRGLAPGRKQALAVQWLGLGLRLLHLMLCVVPASAPCKQELAFLAPAQLTHLGPPKWRTGRQGAAAQQEGAGRQQQWAIQKPAFLGPPTAPGAGAKWHTGRPGRCVGGKDSLRLLIPQRGA